MLGDQVKRFESGSRGVLTISSGRGDPGGKSYGTYQLASKTGTLQKFVKTPAVKAHLDGIPLASAKFDAAWKYLATTNPALLKQAEFDFIKRTHYDPVRLFANSIHLPDTAAINEAIWSISIQHGKAKQILSSAVALQKSNPALYPKTESGLVHALYDARSTYVKKLGMSNLLTRYKEERKVVLKMASSTPISPKSADAAEPKKSALSDLFNSLKSLIK